MEFDDHEDEEIGLPGLDPVLGNSSRPKPGGVDLTAGNCNRNGVGGGGRYRECLKNHAVGMGGHAVDGCGEFLAAGEEGTLDALLCAACSCHRNFHRKELENRGFGDGDLSPPAPTALGFHNPYSQYYRTPAGYLQYHHHHHHNQMAAAAATAPHHRPLAALPYTSPTAGAQSKDELDDFGGLGPSSSGKKRFRTKFSPEQKGKMLAFAERVGWRIQKHDEAELQQFCDETSVKRHVFKVWMHNNKHHIGKPCAGQAPSPPPPPVGH